MATLVFSALGTLVGGPLGGAIGALLGRQVDSMVLGSGSREGPRLKELTATTSSYGAAVPRLFGRMRVGGTIIWATDLVENRDSQGGGKGRPAVTSYAYSSSFAVALSSRRIASIGRIWADGNLLRGAAGDLKTGGTMRFYPGFGDQSPDPLMMAAETEQGSPAYRDLAYVVFEDLQLADFGNRIPALTFEVFADDGAVTVAALAGSDYPEVDSTVELQGIDGLSQESPLSDTFGMIQQAIPLYYDVTAGKLAVTGKSGGDPVALREPTIATKDGDFGGLSGFAAKRGRISERSPAALRYYDVGRDYQPGVQRASGPVQPGQPTTVEIPCAMRAASARDLIEAMARRTDWSRQTMQWRTAEIDPSWRPGALVTVPRFAGIWRILSWEWRASGLELSLARTPFAGAPAALSVAADTGRAAVAQDLEIGTTSLLALELPWDGIGAGEVPVVRVAAAAAASGWAGAALFLDQGDGQLLPFGATGRTRAALGDVVGALSQGPHQIMDRTSILTIDLVSSSASLNDASMRQLAMGANRALVGTEVIQFARATPLGDRRWQLSALLRGRGGTEPDTGSHVAGERFVLLDDSLIALDGSLIGSNSSALVKAIGAGDIAPVSSQIVGRGITQRPLCPVHPKSRFTPDGSLELAWTRRARGAWAWRDQVDTPLHEQTEVYEVVLGSVSNAAALWITTEPHLTIAPAEFAVLVATYPGAPIIVRQRGSYASSTALLLTHIS